jgi:hypothetical protein
MAIDDDPDYVPEEEGDDEGEGEVQEVSADSFDRSGSLNLSSSSSRHGPDLRKSSADSCPSRSPAKRKAKRQEKRAQSGNPVKKYENYDRLNPESAINRLARMALEEDDFGNRKYSIRYGMKKWHLRICIVFFFFSSFFCCICFFFSPIC